MRRAIFTGPSKPLKVIDDVLPDVTSGGALIKTSYGGVCHSDVHFRQSTFDMGGGEVFSPFATYGEKYIGSTFGHEVSGTLVTLGDEVDLKSTDLQIGDKVIVYACYGCESCGYCKAGESNLCPNGFDHCLGVGPKSRGGFATHVMVPNYHNLVKVPESIPMHMACMLPCAGATAYSALLQTKTEVERALRGSGEANLLIIGVGGIGFWCVQLAKKLIYLNKNVKVFVADLSEERVTLALEEGADEGFVWGRDDTILNIVEQTTKKGEIQMEAVIDFVGIGKTAEAAMKCLGTGGILLMRGLNGGSMSLKLPQIVFSSLTIKGWSNATYQEIVELVRLVSEVDIKLPPLAFRPLEDVNKALDELESGTMTGRSILKFTDE